MDMLGQNEYADELVIVAVAMELHVHIVFVPCTPPQAPRPWAVSTYSNTGAVAEKTTTMYTTCGWTGCVRKPENTMLASAFVTKPALVR